MSNSTIVFKPAEKSTLVRMLANQASHAPMALGAKGYFHNLVQQTNWPAEWKNRRTGGLTGIPDADARAMLDWTLNQGSNPEDPRMTVLGDLLEVLKADVGLEERRWLAAVIQTKGLFLDEGLADRQAMRFQIPLPAALKKVETEASAASAAITESGPNIDWAGPHDEVEYQKFLRPEPNFQDIGFLTRAIRSAAAVCRIEIPRGTALGTGFLLAPDLVLTNCHVMIEMAGQDIEQRARDVVLRFGHVTAEDGKEAEGIEFRLASSGPVLGWSPADKLDYVLLRVEAGIKRCEAIAPVPYTTEDPFTGMPLNILQHPAGETLKLALSGDGVVKVFPENGLVQYATRALRGSSGAPCFTDDWKIIALHHAQRMKRFGAVREGIQFKFIHEKIKGYL